MPVLLFGGLFANNSLAADWLGWLQYVSPIKYAAEAIIENEYQEDKHGNKEAFVEFLDYGFGFWKSVGILAALIVGFRVIALIAFKLLVKKFQ
mmetsp:Transcript_111/g.219  ORF Transcript_111/g.219 Transcript_111/m.219 type:complete len:93 (+) Transcript_111:1251-1529(+)